MVGTNSTLTAEKLLATTGENVRRSWLRKAENDVRFAHATGRLRSLAVANMTAETLLRFSDNTTSVQQLHEFLDQANYPAASTLEERIEKGAAKNLFLLRETAVRTSLPEIFALDSNFHNLKWLLKNLLLYKDNKPEGNLANDGIPTQFTANLMQSATWPLEKLWQDCLRLFNNSSNCQVIPQSVALEIAKALQAYFQHQDIGAVTKRLDQLYFITLHDMACAEGAKSEREFVLDYLALQADAANLQSCLRAWQAKLQPASLLTALVPGGEVKVTDLFQVYKKLLTVEVAGEGALDLDFFTKLFYPLYRGTMSESLLPVVSAWNSAEGRTEFTRRADELILRLALKGRCNTYGCEAVAGLFLEKQIEIKNLRIMLALRTVGKSFEERLAMLRKGDYYGTR